MNAKFVIFSCWPGVKTALGSIRKHLSETGCNCRTYEYGVEGLNFKILSELKNQPPDYLIVGGWDNNIKMIVQNAVRSKTKVFLLWCSPVTQIDLGGEIGRFLEVLHFLKNGLIDHVGIILESDYQVLKNFHDGFEFFPIYMETDNMDSVNPNVSDYVDGKVNVDLFCAPNPRKNLISQMLVLSTFKNVFVHTNYDNPMSSIPYQGMMNSFLVNKHKNHPWLDRGKYLSFISSMDFASQVTLSESFNYTAAEHMYYGVPVMMGISSPISAGFTGDLRKNLLVEKHDDLQEMKVKIERLVSEENYRTEMGLLSQEYIRDFNNKNLERLKESMMGVFK